MNALRAGIIKDALAAVHHWESRERGAERIERSEACEQACRMFALSSAERGILRRALNLAVGLALLLSAGAARAHCSPVVWEMLEPNEAASYCEAAERPGTYEWATERAIGCEEWGGSGVEARHDAQRGRHFVAVCYGLGLEVAP